jgi:hypothetical protein
LGGKSYCQPTYLLGLYFNGGEVTFLSMSGEEKLSTIPYRIQHYSEKASDAEPSDTNPPNG